MREWGVRAFEWLFGYIKRWESIFHSHRWLVRALIFLALTAFAVWRERARFAAGWGPLTDSDWAAARSYLALSGGITIVVTFALPFLAHQLHLFQIRDIGLEYVSVRSGKCKTYCEQFARAQPKGKPVRVLCISGKDLFVPRDEGPAPPLFDFVERGKLQVLMPDPNDTGTTVRKRWQTYEREVTRSAYPDESALRREVAEVKEYLKSANHNNAIREHVGFCVWRVILFEKYCVAQSYFPHPSQKKSSEAPFFVFSKYGKDGNENTHSYYNTFEQLFVHEWERSAELRSPPTQGGSLPPSHPPGRPPLAPPAAVAASSSASSSPDVSGAAYSIAEPSVPPVSLSEPVSSGTPQLPTHPPSSVPPLLPGALAGAAEESALPEKTQRP